MAYHSTPGKIAKTSTPKLLFRPHYLCLRFYHDHHHNHIPIILILLILQDQPHQQGPLLNYHHHHHQAKAGLRPARPSKIVGPRYG